MKCRSEKIKWIGLWLNFNGYWDGIKVENEMGELNEHLMQVPEGCLQPKDNFLSSTAFYDAMIGKARRDGFDFVKVDNQSKNLDFYKGTERPVRAANNNQQALEQACARHMDGLINCMAHNSQNLFNTRISAVTRCSEDYAKGKEDRARRHLHNSYANIVWIGHTVWGDHDMFHSNDPASGRIMALSKAMSGGPVYLSDAPGKFELSNISPLCFEDGELLRPIAPAAPLPDSLFVDPFVEANPYRAIAPLPNRCAAVVAYNLTEPVVPVSGAFTAEDYTQAGAMTQLPAQKWEIPEEGLVLYDWEKQTAMRLDSPYEFALEKFSDIFALICPIQNGWSLIGRTDKFLSPSAVKLFECTEDRMILRMNETGPLAIYSERGTITAGDCPVEKAGENLWIVRPEAGERDRLMVLDRSA
jgi:hypothetical protein